MFYTISPILDLHNYERLKTNMSAISPVNVSIKLFTRKEMYRLIHIEQDTNPWCLKDFDRFTRKKNSMVVVAMDDETAIGYMIVETLKDSYSLVKMAVKEDMRRMGIGSKLINYLTTQLVATKRHRIFTEIRESNLTGQLFLRSCRFRYIDTSYNQFQDTGEDSYHLEYRPTWPEKIIENDKKGYYAKV